MSYDTNLHEVGEEYADGLQFAQSLQQLRVGEHAVAQTVVQHVHVKFKDVVDVRHLDVVTSQQCLPIKTVTQEICVEKS